MTRKNIRPMGYPHRTVCSVNAGMKQAAAHPMRGPLDMPVMREQSLAMVFPVNQEFCDLYEPDAALCRGTLFKELDKPFCY